MFHWQTQQGLLHSQTALQEAIHAPHAEARARTISALETSPLFHHQSTARRLAQCATTARLYRPQPGKPVQVYVHRCKSRLCPFCGHGRSNHVAQQIEHRMNKMGHPRLIVLTVKSLDLPLRDQIHQLRTWFRALRATRVWRDKVASGLYTIETTRNAETALWHPHINVLYNGDYFPFRALQHAWHQITKASKVVWISEVRDKHGAAWELAKYAGKPQDSKAWPVEALREYASAIHGARLIHEFGDRQTKAIEDADPHAHDRPTGYSVSLPRLVYLANNDNQPALRVLIAAAARFPTLARYIWLQLPQIEPDDVAAARMTAAIHQRASPPIGTTKQAENAPSREKLDADLDAAFRVLQIHAEAGLLHETQPHEDPESWN